jgi:cytochrome c6
MYGIYNVLTDDSGPPSGMTDTFPTVTTTQPTLPTETTETTDTTETTETTETEPALEGDPVAGRDMFITAAACGSCHTLADAETTGTIGPNLDDAMPSQELVIERVTLGEGVMPSYAEKLSEQEIADVAAYVVQATRDREAPRIRRRGRPAKRAFSHAS